MEKHSRKKILIIGEMFSDNLGDGIICEIVQKTLNDFNTEILDLSGRIEFNNENDFSSSFSILTEYQKYIKEKLKKILKILNIKVSTKKIDFIYKNFKNLFDNKVNKPDIILFAGGQLLMGCFLKPIEYIINYAEKNSIPVFFNACGLGKLDGINEKKEIQRILNSKNVLFISVRDGSDKISSLGITNPILITHDTAILCSKYKKIKKKQKNKIGIGIMISHDICVNRQIKFWSKIINKINNNNENWEVFCNGSTEDYEFAKYILNKLNYSIEKHLCERPVYPDELINIIGSYKKIISMRLHSLIIAYSYNVPAIAISWDKKVSAFYEKIGNADLCFSFSDNINKIINCFENMKLKNADKNKIEQTITTNIRRMINKINEN